TFLKFLKMICRVFCFLAIFLISSTATFAQDSLYVKLDGKNRVKELGTLRNGEKHGLFFKYKNNGKHKSFIYENGKKRKLATSEVTTEKKYDPKSKGQILEESFGILKDGKRDGLWLTFNNNNIFITASMYNAGVLEGTNYDFHPDGEVRRIEHYKNGEKHGSCKEFHAGGALHYNMQYVNGKVIDGNVIYFYPNGNKKIVNSFKNGYKSGKSTTYYESGAVEIEGEYRGKGTPEGPWKEYYENGTLKEEYYYKHGLFHGEYNIYDENGKVLEQYIYRNDKLIKTIRN
ncbi:MAG: toxin-antitoxin system YwqK family antitoxin, partial [Bacteroidota bacterium]